MFLKQKRKGYGTTATLPKGFHPPKVSDRLRKVSVMEATKRSWREPQLRLEKRG